MTDPNYTAMLLVIDRSGSMEAIRHDMVGGLTTMLASQAALPGLLTVDVVTFDDEIEVQRTMAEAASVVIALEPRGATALFDAIGFSVNAFGQSLAALPEHARPGVVQVVVVTDGEENSSREFTAGAIRALVTRQTDEFGWDFVFLGANQNAVLTGASLGFAVDSSLTYTTDGQNVGSMNASLGRYVTDVRNNSRQGFTAAERSDASS